MTEESYSFFTENCWVKSQRVDILDIFVIILLYGKTLTSPLKIEYDWIPLSHNLKGIGIGYTAVSQAVLRLGKKIREDRRLEKIVQDIEKGLLSED